MYILSLIPQAEWALWPAAQVRNSSIETEFAKVHDHFSSGIQFLLHSSLNESAICQFSTPSVDCHPVIYQTQGVVRY